MFQAVRQWWGNGRGKLTARLFVFEFVVVVAGVLAAQALANWVGTRAEREAGRRLFADATESARQLDRTLGYWQRFAPCLRSHVASISRAAANGGPMSGDAIGRPALPRPGEPQFSADDWRRIALVATPDQVQSLRELQATASVHNAYASEIARQWSTFRLLDPSLGAASPEDRSRVRAAAMQVDSTLRWMMNRRMGNPADFRPLGLGSTPIDPAILPRVDSCGMLKDWR